MPRNTRDRPPQLRRFVFRIFRRQRGQFFACDQANGKRFDRGSFRFDNLGRGLRRRRQKKMADAKPLRHEKILPLRFVKSPAFILGNIDIVPDPL